MIFTVARQDSACMTEEGTRSHYRWCEPPCGCWELNSGPLEEQSVLLTAELSLQPYKKYLFFVLNSYVYEYFACICIVYHTCAWFHRGQRGWNWTYRWLCIEE
ncbi:hypothetical protein LEMLEM_LOCUS287, partial [Lemmus lemmus]